MCSVKTSPRRVEFRVGIPLIMPPAHAQGEWEGMPKGQLRQRQNNNNAASGSNPRLGRTDLKVSNHPPYDSIVHPNLTYILVEVQKWPAELSQLDPVFRC